MTPSRGNSRLGLLLAIVVLAWNSTAFAALPGGKMPSPRLVGPERGAVAQEAGLRLAWTPPAGATRQVVVISRADFDARSWTRPPVGTAFQIVEVRRPIATLADLGVNLDAEGDLYWAVGAGVADGPLAFSETRSVRVRPKFENRLEPSPYLQTLPVQPMSPAALGAADEGPRRIRLAAGYEIDPSRGEPALPQALRGGASAPGASRNVLVHYGDADPERVREQVAAAGGSVVAYIPDRTFLVRLRPQQGFALDAEGWVGEFQPAYKLSPQLDRQTATAANVTVLAFPDGDLAAIESAVAAAGGRVVQTSDNGINKLLRASLPGTAVAELAQHADVQWIEPTLQYELHNTQVQWNIQTFVVNNRRIWDQGLQGQNQVLHHSDSGIDMTHEMYSDAGLPVVGIGHYPTHRKVIAYELGSDYPDIAFGDHAGASYHGSHTAGTALGKDLTAPLAGFDGIAREAKVWHSDLAGPTMANGLAPPVDLNDLFQPSYTGNAGGAARISSNSWGAASAAGAYTIDASNVDRFMWDHPDYLILFSTGNSGGPGSIGSPCTAKNSVGVGGTRNSTSLSTARLIYSSTSRGPCDDGRRKPTITAPAQTVHSANVGPASYQTLSGTSMSTPGAAGATALLRQYCTAGYYPTGAPVPANGFTPSAALMKAMLVNSGVNDVSTFVAPDMNIGYGRVCLDSTMYFTGDRRRLLLIDHTEGLGQGQQIEFKVNVVNDSTPLEATLCWTDFPASVASSLQLVNNLNLVVTDGVSTYRGNVYNGATGFSNTGGTADFRNVEEAVNIKFPAPGIWTIRVEAPVVPSGPQPFALAITGGVGTNAGVLTLDRASYGSGSSAEVQVVDTNGGGSINVTITSPTEPAGETLVLAGASGLYQGALPLSPIQGSNGDGILQVSHGDVITATYQDASPVATLTQTATIGLAGPVITDVTAASNAAAQATVTWTTNTSSSTNVYYGPTPALGSVSQSDLSSITHTTTLTGLTPGQTYYYDVESEDLNGNLTRDDNGGQHYRFTVRAAGDLLLIYTGEYELASRYTAELDALGWQWDLWDSAPLGDNPTVGNLGTGMRSYDVVWMQAGMETYPPISDAARDSVTAYLNGGGRLGIVGHDVVWSNSDPTSPYFSAARQTWTQTVAKSTYIADPAGWSQVIGIGADPISGDYTAGLPYTEIRSGASGDEITPFGGAVTSWNSNDGTPAPAGLRWDSGAPQGTAGTGVWGGQNSRLATMWFEWGRIDPFSNTSATRRAVLDKSLTWLLGRAKPSIAVTFPNGGEVVTSSPVNVTWNETLSAGAGARTIEYSLDGGDSWTVITTSAGASPYVWDLTGVPNTLTALVRVRVTDDGTPAFTGYDASNAVFSIQRTGGDLVGPAVVAGSVQTSPNPVSNLAAGTLNATVTDASAGGSSIAAAEWSFGPSPKPAGSGNPMTVPGATPTENVTVSLPTSTFPTGTYQIWVRGQDAAGNWGPATSMTVIVNGDNSVSAPDGQPAAFELRAFAPNPVVGTSAVRFAMPKESKVRLAIFDITGRRVRTLVDGTLGAGTYTRTWDRSDESGRLVQPGVYWARMEVAGKTLLRKVVTLN